MKYQVITKYKDDLPETKASCERYDEALHEAWSVLQEVVLEMSFDLSGEEVAQAYRTIEHELFSNGYVEFYDYTVAVVLERLNQERSFDVEVFQSSVFCEWDDLWVNVNIDIKFMSLIAKFRNLLGSNADLDSVNIKPCSGLISEESFKALNDTVRVGTERIELDHWGAYYQITAKDCPPYFAEYHIVDLRVLDKSSPA